MGSSFSIFNETDETVWVYVEFDSEVIFSALDDVSKIVQCGAKVGAAIASTGIQRRAIKDKTGRNSSASEGVAFGLSSRQWGTVGTVASMVSMGIGKIEQMTLREDRKRRSQILSYHEILEKEERGEYERIKPGRGYRKCGTLDTKYSVYLVDTSGKTTKYTCCTGVKDKDNKEYYLNEDGIYQYREC